MIEAELAAMAACGHPMTVQKVLTPIFPAFERVARWLYVRRERRVGRRDAGSPLGAASPLAQAEMRAALDAQNQLLFWFEARVVSRDHAACRMVAGAIAGRRQENMLRQRNTSFTRGLHRRRVALARPGGDPLMAPRRRLGRRGGDALAAAVAADRPHPARAPHDPARARPARHRPRARSRAALPLDGAAGRAAGGRASAAIDGAADGRSAPARAPAPGEAAA